MEKELETLSFSTLQKLIIFLSTKLKDSSSPSDEKGWHNSLCPNIQRERKINKNIEQ